jgi:hypothetical protein
MLEGINSLLQAAKARARGYRSTRNLLAMAYLVAGKLNFRLAPERGEVGTRDVGEGRAQSTAPGAAKWASVTSARGVCAVDRARRGEVGTRDCAHAIYRRIAAGIISTATACARANDPHETAMSHNKGSGRCSVVCMKA